MSDITQFIVGLDSEPDGETQPLMSQPDTLPPPSPPSLPLNLVAQVPSTIDFVVQGDSIWTEEDLAALDYEDPANETTRTFDVLDSTQFDQEVVGYQSGYEGGDVLTRVFEQGQVTDEDIRVPQSDEGQQAMMMSSSVNLIIPQPHPTTREVVTNSDRSVASLSSSRVSVGQPGESQEPKREPVHDALAVNWTIAGTNTTIEEVLGDPIFLPDESIAIEEMRRQYQDVITDLVPSEVPAMDSLGSFPPCQPETLEFTQEKVNERNQLEDQCLYVSGL